MMALVRLSLLLALSQVPSLSAQSIAPSYSSWAQTVFTNLGSTAASSASVSSSSSTSTTTVTLNGAANGKGVGGSPFNSVFGTSVTVSASSNLAYPFTSNQLNGHSFQDLDTGIDVLAGGIVTFRMPPAGTGMWCFELGRSLTGRAACSGPAGYAFDYYSYNCAPARQQDAPCAAAYPGANKCENSMINGAWNSSDAPRGSGAPTIQRGSALGFTYARSGALMARVGAHGQSNQQANENPNNPVGEYFSAFDHVDLCPAVVTPQSATTGLSNTYTSVSSGRLYLAIWRWSFYPQLANGTVTVLIDYTSPLQVAASSSSISGTAAGSVAHPVVLQQSLNSPLAASVSLNTSSAGTVTLLGYLPVVNLSMSTAVSGWVNASGYTVQGALNQVSWGNASAQNGGYSDPWLSWSLPPSAALVTIPGGNGAVGVDLGQMVGAQQFGFIFPATSTSMPLNPWWQQYYPPSANDYDNDFDSQINVIEGGTITLTAPASDQWCGPTDWDASTAPFLCVNAQGATQLPLPWNGCSGQFRSIYSNATQFGWTPTSNGYDNSGCNSDSDLQAPVNAVVFRIGQDSTSMSNAGYLSTEIHSNDYYLAFPNAPSNGVLSYTFTAAQSGRLYLARQGPGGSSASNWNGTIRVTAQYSPPPNIKFGLTWSPSPTGVSQPYLFNAPTSNSSSALSAAGLVNGRYLQIPDTFSGQTVTATFWVYQQVFSGSTTGSNPNTNGAVVAAAATCSGLVTTMALAVLMLV